MVNGVACLLMGGGVIWGQTVHVIVGQPNLRLPIDNNVYIPIYVFTQNVNDYIGNFSFALATDDYYIASRHMPFDSVFYMYFCPPINSWDLYRFEYIYSNTPQNGWTSQLMWGIYDLGGLPNPCLHANDTTLLGYFRMRTTTNTGVIGVTDSIFALGEDPMQGDVSFGDTVGNQYSDIRLHFYPVTFTAQWDSANAGTGISVRNRYQSHIDTKWDGNQSKFITTDISRRQGYNPHGHNGQMQNTAYINTLKYGTGVLADRENYWTAPDQASAIDAHKYAGLVYDFLLNTIGRNGYDSTGHSMISIVENNLMRNNSYYDPTTEYVHYSIVDSGYSAFSGWLDVVAHEWGHGVTHHCSDLIHEREPGALMEAFSDIMGATCSKVMQNNPRWWIHGDSINSDGRMIRNMQTPTQPQFNQLNPDTYQGQYWQFPTDTTDGYGKHKNACVVDKMFYLLAAGGMHRGITVQGIGIENAFKVMYEANRNRWDSSETFIQAKRHCVTVADSLNQTGEWGKWTGAAWNAVGVCPYVVGDVNCNGECRGSDITYLVSALGGSSPAKPNCLCTDLNNVHIAFWVTADYNGDCLIMGSDVTYGVRYFKGLGPAPVPCGYFPPN